MSGPDAQAAPSLRLRALWESGEYQRFALEHASVDAFGIAVGMSRDALLRARQRLAGEGLTVPGYADIRRRQLVINGNHPAVPDSSPPAILTVGEPIVAPPPRTVDHDLAERKAKAESAQLRSRLADALAQLEQSRIDLATMTEADAARLLVEPIRPREHVSGLREATAVALASDWHIEETVEAANVNDVNEYNLAIAHRRCERYFAGVEFLTKYHREHFKIRDMILWLGGDLITGYLREEDLEANGVSPVQAIATLTVWLSAGIRHLLATTDLELIRVVCNSGNHGRLTKKTQPRTREANSIEWLMYATLAREFATEPRVKFTLPHGSQTYVRVYDQTIRFTHGDETKFGGGVGGIMIPIRKAIAKWQTVRHADLNVIGHYHQEHFLRDLVVNGSLVGYNEYALSIAAPYEDPRQGFFLMDSKRGITFPSTVWVSDRDGLRARAA